MQTKPVLYVFGISHYCEKARWALDYLGIDYKLHFLAAGLHGRAVRKLGAPRSSLPVLATGNEVIQGSAAIIDWAEAYKAAHTAQSVSLESPDNQDEVKQIEKRLDDVLGVHVRRYYYSEALVFYPAQVRAIFTSDLAGFPKVFTLVAWPLIRRLMMKGMDLGAAQHLQSRERVAKELEWLDGLLADKQYLVGDRLSRADLTAASLLAPLVSPAQHPKCIQLPPKLSADSELWRQRRSMQWTADLYGKYRSAH
ncbi:MAG: glutathione S-transferase [Porticoccaceae bacterium]|nr:glutathione S-transferase [Porticoccaceae bacterium]